MISKSLSFLIISIALFTIGIILAKKDTFNLSEENCISKPSECGSEENCCAVWDGSQCRKGTLSGNSCVSKGKILPLILIILGFIFLAIGIFMFFRK